MTISSRRSLAAFSAAALLLALPRPAAATYVCAVMASPDGFVALRDAPSPRAKEIMRAKPGHAVVILQKPNGDQITQGSWHRVFYYPGDVIPEKSDPAYKKGREGWMHKRYVSDCG